MYFYILAYKNARKSQYSFLVELEPFDVHGRAGSVLSGVSLEALMTSSQYERSNCCLCFDSCIRALEVDCCSTAKNGAVETLATSCLSAQWFCSCGLPRNSQRTVLLTAVRRWNCDYQALKMVPIGCRCLLWLVESETPQ